MLKQFIPENSSPTLEKFINYLMIGGKKSIARRIVNDTFTIISKKTQKDPEEVFKIALENVKPKQEVRAKRIGGAVYQIPREVPLKRQNALAFRWIIGAARGKKGAAMSQKLANELIDASNEQGISIKKRDDTHRMAQANKAFSHLARY